MEHQYAETMQHELLLGIENPGQNKSILKFSIPS